MEVNTQGGRPASWAIPKIYNNKPFSLNSANPHVKSDFIGGLVFLNKTVTPWLSPFS